MVTGFDVLGVDKNLQEHWIKRVVAYIIDIIIIAVVIWIIFWFLLGWARWLETGLITGLIVLLYFTVLEATACKSLGKALLGMEVSAIDGFMDFRKSIIRNITKFFWFILPALDWVIGMATEGDPKQRFMDRIAGTVVIGDFESLPQKPSPQPTPGNPAAGPAEKCLYCGATLMEIEGARFQCTSCGIIQ
jgi:uncharacterized RDD family membrane protein YckC